MSRLDGAIARLTAQRACIDHAAALLGGEACRGIVLELGLGNGRTYDHLRARLPRAAIHAFDRQLAAHPRCVPPAGLLHLGDFADTLPALAAELGPVALLAHADVGDGTDAASAARAALLADALPPLLAPGALVLCDQDVPAPGWERLPEPADCPPGRYHLWRAR